jgi:hypothetical protein
MSEQEMIARLRWLIEDSRGDKVEMRRETAIAILTTLEASRTPGMVMVPREPTEAMIEAGRTYEMGCRRDCWLGAPRAWEVWKAMLAASPTPSPEGAE